MIGVLVINLITYLKISISEASMVFVINLYSFIEKNLLLILPCVVQAKWWCAKGFHHDFCHLNIQVWARFLLPSKSSFWWSSSDVVPTSLLWSWSCSSSFGAPNPLLSWFWLCSFYFTPSFSFLVHHGFSWFLVQPNFDWFVTLIVFIFLYILVFGSLWFLLVPIGLWSWSCPYSFTSWFLVHNGSS